MVPLKFQWMLSILVAMLLLAGCGRGYESALVLLEVAGKGGEGGLKARTPAPTRMAVVYRVNGREYRGDLYRPGVPAEAGVVLVPGAAEKGKDDPRLTAFATTLARVRFAVLVPDLAGLRELKVGPENVREIADAYAWLASRPDLTPGGRGGIFAFSYAAGPAILAALEPDIRERTRFVLAVGGYHDLVEVITFFTTGYYRHKGRWHYLEPNHYGKWVFVLSYCERLGTPRDREILRQMARRRMEDERAEIGDLAERLGPEGRQVYALISNRDPNAAPSLAAGLPAPVRADLAALTLAGKPLHRLGARIILVHGLDDDIIPYSESVALSAALPPGKSRLFITRGLFHVDVRPGLLDSWRMWRAVDALLMEREAR